MDALIPVLEPAPGSKFKKFVGDTVRFVIRDAQGRKPSAGWSARLRTNLGRASQIASEIIHARAAGSSFSGGAWHDILMRLEGDVWVLDLPLTEPGYFQAKAYLIDPKGWQSWPDGSDLAFSVHSDEFRTANTIYCAFTRMFGESRSAVSTRNPERDVELQRLDSEGYTVIPPSGKLRDVLRQLPHIMDTLGCRYLHLLPINPVPTTYAKTEFGRFGSPYACEDLTAIDPALVEFDKRTTGVEQFAELAHAVHKRGGRIILDMVINHTGWGSTLQEEHPEWFLRKPDGTFISPGAWGTTWEDLVELEPHHVELWEYLASAFITWCGRGVDGFRCDAGYKVPMVVWQYIISRVRREFPDALFLLEGLGGGWDLTEQLISEGGMQWAYSELFQNHTGLQVGAYLDHSLKQSASSGLLVNYSETHDNDRLARNGRGWSLLRNRLCALASVSGGFGFTCGVEWLAPERVNVHSSRGLSWSSSENIVPELSTLNRLLAGHPCFFDNARIKRLSSVDSTVLALRRDSGDGQDAVLVLANTDAENARTLLLDETQLEKLQDLKFDLTGGKIPKIECQPSGEVLFHLAPAACHCLAEILNPKGMTGEVYRKTRAQSAWAVSMLGKFLPVEGIPLLPWLELAGIASKNPARILSAALSKPSEAAVMLTPGKRGESENESAYIPLVYWILADLRRVLPVPPRHWLMVCDENPFRAHLTFGDGKPPRHVQSIEVEQGHIACFEPCDYMGDASLRLERFGQGDSLVESAIRFLSPDSLLNELPYRDHALTLCRPMDAEYASRFPSLNGMVLLTNGIGGMARMSVDFGNIQSKYDCLLGANLNPQVPVDRHVFAKRARLWINADGFIGPLDGKCLVSFKPGPPAVWHFSAGAGDGRTVEVEVEARMLPQRNTTILQFTRCSNYKSKGEALPADRDVRLTVRVDIEDRNFHWETVHNAGSDYHFNSNTHTLENLPGFLFSPSGDRQIQVVSSEGEYHPQVEWCENIQHPVEQSRGQTGSGDAFSPGWFEIPLKPAATVSLSVCADLSITAESLAKDMESSGSKAVDGIPGKMVSPKNDWFGQQLLKAAQDFVVRRNDGVTVIAGYPWFLDWGRDSLIAARGLLAGGMENQVAQLLGVFARFEESGTLPNTIHGDDASNRDTSDAPLWFGVVCEDVAAIEGNSFYDRQVVAGGRTFRDVLTSIAGNYASGTPNGIRMDTDSGLIWSPSHFTWMDTNYPAGTPREGYPVEIQALWIRLLRHVESITVGEEKIRWGRLAALATGSLERFFWIDDKGWLSDLLIAKPGVPAAQAHRDDALRSNALFAVSLGLIHGERARKIVDASLKYLVVPGALRTLAPLQVTTPLAVYGNGGQLLNDPLNPYWGTYQGDEDTRRKPAYHNGTAWTWTFPVFCEALAMAYDGNPLAIQAARAYLGSMDHLILHGCIGQVPEILDGDAPHTQRGCDAQAWGVTEAIRVWRKLQDSGN